MAADVEIFKKLYFQEFSTALTDEEATQKAQSLMKLYKAVYGSPEIKNNDENKHNARSNGSTTCFSPQ